MDAVSLTGVGHFDPADGRRNGFRVCQVKNIYIFYLDPFGLYEIVRI